LVQARRGWGAEVLSSLECTGLLELFHVRRTLPAGSLAAVALALGTLSPRHLIFCVL
jgi:hypothetical protein